MRGWLLAVAVLAGGADAAPGLDLTLQQRAVIAVSSIARDATLAAKCGLRTQVTAQRILDALNRGGAKMARQYAVEVGIGQDEGSVTSFAKAAVLAGRQAGVWDFLRHGDACRKLESSGALGSLDEIIRSLDAGVEP